MFVGAYEYGRVGLPNPHELGAAVAALEGADEGVATSTGGAYYLLDQSWLVSGSCKQIQAASGQTYYSRVGFK